MINRPWSWLLIDSFHVSSGLFHPPPEGKVSRAVLTAVQSPLCGQFTRIGHIPGVGRPLLREDRPISYEATPFEFFKPAPSASPASWGFRVLSLLSLTKGLGAAPELGVRIAGLLPPLLSGPAICATKHWKCSLPVADYTLHALQLSASAMDRQTNSLPAMSSFKRAHSTW